MSIFNLATSFKFKTRDYKTHLTMAMLLEEKYFYENIYGPTDNNKDDNLNKLSKTLSSQNKVIIEGSKEEEISAICVQRNYGFNPTDAQKLKALDEEYHYLIGLGQSHKAEQVQLLYQFKAKKISNSIINGQQQQQQMNKISETGDYLLKANLKYTDSLSIILESKQSNFLVYFLMGRSYCQLGDYQQAMIYLKICLDWSDPIYQTISRYYFAYAMSKLKNLTDSNPKVVISYLCSGLQLFLKHLSRCLHDRNTFFSKDHFSLLQPLFLEGFLIVGKLKIEYFETSNEFISAENAFR
jgi:tetratricopeptide (TPR) repeat protein